MNKILIISKMTMLENSRKQIFHVLCLVVLAIIASTTLLSVLTEGAKLKILKDLAMSSMLLGGAVLSIALASSAIPNDIENRTIYPILSRPIGRMQYILGKFLGSVFTVGIALAAMSIVFIILIVSYEGKLDWYLLPAIGFTFLQVCLITAFTIALSVCFTPSITATLSLLIYMAGSMKMGYLDGLLERSAGFSKVLLGIIYHVLPNLESFNLKNSLVHHDGVALSYMMQVILYTVLYIVFALSISSLFFNRKEI